MNIKKVLIEFIITFAIIYLLYYIFVIRKCKKNQKQAPVEVSLILSMYKIDLDKVPLYDIVKSVSLVTTLIMSLIITIISNFFDSVTIILIFGGLMSVLLAIIIYRIIGRHYEKKSNEINNKKK